VSRRTAKRDAWLFLPPEVERLVPRLVEQLGVSSAAAEAARIDRLVCRGDATAWFVHLRGLCDRLARAVAERGASEQARTLALVLRDQYLLALGIREPDPRDATEVERLDRLLRDRLGGGSERPRAG